MISLLWVVIGAMVGWAIGELMQNDEFGLAGHIAIGIIGGLAGGYFFELINIPIMGSLVMAMMGATGLVFAGRVARFNSP